MSNQERDRDSVQDAESLVEVIFGMAELLNAGLNKDAIRASIELLGAGMDPLTLANKIKMLKSDANKEKQQQQQQQKD
ncbi:hypothetical protein AWZ03_000074 [Drosophila navojoa]|uniref:Mitotic-spindle organizing protein 1 n=1 Tax=Drosophila navojoa TaxID=7232 RepID=A0A484BWQ8_DRONA|nr:hypothetical protein AWZ03_000074 [Drosophila navojoa]